MISSPGCLCLMGRRFLAALEAILSDLASSDTELVPQRRRCLRVARERMRPVLAGLWKVWT